MPSDTNTGNTTPRHIQHIINTILSTITPTFTHSSPTPTSTPTVSAPSYTIKKKERKKERKTNSRVFEIYTNTLKQCTHTSALISITIRHKCKDEIIQEIYLNNMFHISVFTFFCLFVSHWKMTLMFYVQMCLFLHVLHLNSAF